jgi:hypothetical protein
VVRRSVQLAPFAALMLAALMLAGCGRPPGVDGSLTNHWPAMPEPTLPAVTAPACYFISTFDEVSKLERWPAPVACTSAHNVETFFVGQFTGAAAQAPSPPRVGGEVTIPAYAECTRAAREYLGDDWRTAKLEVDLVIPTQAHWELGARWYQCDVAQYKLQGTGWLELRNASAKGLLAAPGDVRYDCFKDTASADQPVDMVPVACTDGHNVEFVGVVDLPAGPYLKGDARAPTAEKACLPAIAAYAGLPNDNDMQYRTGWFFSEFTSDEWALGNRGLRCFLWSDTKVLTKSMKGAGPKAFPVR